MSSRLQAVWLSMATPDSASSQVGLINASQAMIQPSGKMIAAAKATVPTIGYQAAAIQLANFTKQTASFLTELRPSASKVKCGTVKVCSIARGMDG